MAERLPSMPGRQLSRTMLTRAATRTAALEKHVGPWLERLRRRKASPQATAPGPQPAGRMSIPLPPRPGETERWDEVDEASWESFPASDPPAHWAGKDKY